MSTLRLIALAIGCAFAQAAMAVDLSVTAFAVNPTTVPLGSPITVTETVKSTGGNTQGSCYVNQSLGQDLTPVVPSSSPVSF